MHGACPLHHDRTLSPVGNSLKAAIVAASNSEGPSLSLWLSIALQASPASPNVSTFDLAHLAEPAPLTALPRCGRDAADDTEVIVCGQKRDRYRLPLPTERDPSPGPVRGEAQSGMAALTPSGRCGIFAGDRRCGKKEAAEYGYGNGRDPITVLSRLARKAVDPDAD
jgi:hypothetical protein